MSGNIGVRCGVVPALRFLEDIVEIEIDDQPDDLLYKQWYQRSDYYRNFKGSNKCHV